MKRKSPTKPPRKGAMKVPQSQTLMSGLHFEAGTPWRIKVDSIDILVDVFGDRLLNAFIRCAAAADRLVTILDCMRLNSAAGVDTVRGERTLMTLACFAAGLVYEFREGLRALRSAGIAAKLSAHGKERWKMLEKFTELTHEDTICQMRNQLAFHIGKEGTVRKGIRRASAEQRKLVVASGDSSAVGEGRHDFALDVILAGLSIRPPGKKKGTPGARRPATLDDFKAAVEEVKDGQFKLISLFDGLLVDVLRHAGAKFDAPRPLPEQDDEAE